MAIQTVNLGTYANDGTGDDLRVAFEKVNANFIEIDSLTVTNAVNLGSGQVLFAGKQASPAIGDNLTFKSLVAGANILLSSTATEVILTSQFSSLTTNLNLNSKNITGTGNIDITGNISLTSGSALIGQDLTVNGTSSLGTAGRVKIFGGATNYILSTDGNGNLSWVSPTPAGGDWEFVDFNGNAPSPIHYLLSEVGVNMGTFDTPSEININLGTF